MTNIPEPIHTIQSMIDAWHEAVPNQPRAHLGCSVLGDVCDRKIWLQFRWAIQEQFKGRILRLFRRGQNEEQQVVNDLKAIGMKITNTGADQYRVDLGSHVGGSLDGIIESGVPEAPNKRHILEIKTHSKKSFDDLEKNGVRKSKPQHWAQMQLYMFGTEIDRALYAAVCKDDDRLYFERVRFDLEAAEALITRGYRISQSERMPEPISGDPSWYQCKMCAAHGFCHEQAPIEHTNCRTCHYADPGGENSTWLCNFYFGEPIPVEFQRRGCDKYVRHNDLAGGKALRVV